MNTREERDVLGSVNVPAGSYAGSFYARAKSNFQISELRAHGSFKDALAYIKIAAAQVNAELGHLDKEYADVIEQAGLEFIDGKFDEDFELDIYQAGAGTPFNMNLNEILANRANELLGGKKGEYEFVHPNNHVNMAQSSNDTIPTAIRIAALIDLQALKEVGAALVAEFDAKAAEFKGMIKVGRTHLQDAVPVTLGQEFASYRDAIDRSLAKITYAEKGLSELGIGGTATGTGINTHPEFSERMAKALTILCGFEFTPMKNKFVSTNSMSDFLATSSVLRILAVELMRISNDLRLMSSGPYAGFAEISLPEVEPGSSIMPGKVNHSVPECLSMICTQVMGLDHAISFAASQGQLELNWHTPLVMWDLLHEIEILTNGMHTFNTLCVSGIKADKERMEELLAKSTAMATALAPHMGYHEVAELVTEAVKKDVPFESLVPEEFKKFLNPESMIKPNRD